MLSLCPRTSSTQQGHLLLSAPSLPPSESQAGPVPLPCSHPYIPTFAHCALAHHARVLKLRCGALAPAAPALGAALILSVGLSHQIELADNMSQQQRQQQQQGTRQSSSRD